MLMATKNYPITETNNHEDKHLKASKSKYPITEEWKRTENL